MNDRSLPEPAAIRRSEGILVGVLGDQLVACDIVTHQAHIVDGLLAWLLLLVVPLPPLQQALFFVFGSLPPAVLNYMFAERYAQEPERVASIVLVGNLLGILTLPLALALMLD